MSQLYLQLANINLESYTVPKRKEEFNCYYPCFVDNQTPHSPDLILKCLLMTYVRMSGFWDNMLHCIPWLFGSLLLGFSCNMFPWSVLISYCLFKSGFLPSSRNLSLKLYHLLRDLQELYMYYQCCNPRGTRDWIGCTTAPRRKDKMKTLAIFSLAGDQKPWQCYSIQWEILMKGSTHLV